MKSFRIFAAAMGIVVISAPALGQSPLADAASREAARRQAARAASVPLYTNQDLDSLPVRARPVAPRPPATEGTRVTTAGVGGDTPEAAAQASAAAAAASGQEGTEPAAARRDEEYWRTRITTARSNLSRAQMFAEALQSRINALSTDFVNRDDPAQRQDIFEQRQKALDELSRVQGEVAGFRQEIADIEEEARRAGVPPGWLR